MSRSSEAFDPSMDEILSSIRKIIADEKKPSVSEKKSPESEDVLELDKPLDEADTASTPPAPAPQSPAPGESLVSQEARVAAEEALSALDFLHSPPRKDPVSLASPASGVKTLEGFIEELICPLLKEWLDSNLPDLVRTVVQREVRSLIRQKGS